MIPLILELKEHIDLCGGDSEAIAPTLALCQYDFVEVLEFNAAKAKQRNCNPQKSFPCGRSCQPHKTRSGKATQCRNPLSNQAKTAQEWLKTQGRGGEAGDEQPSTTQPSQGKSPELEKSVLGAEKSAKALREQKEQRIEDLANSPMTDEEKARGKELQSVADKAEQEASAIEKKASDEAEVLRLKTVSDNLDNPERQELEQKEIDGTLTAADRRRQQELQAESDEAYARADQMESDAKAEADKFRSDAMSRAEREELSYLNDLAAIESAKEEAPSRKKEKEKVKDSLKKIESEAEDDSSKSSDEGAPVVKKKEGMLSTDRDTQPITDLEDFKQELGHAAQMAKDNYNYESLVPIFRLKAQIGDRLSNEQFDEFLGELQANDDIDMLETLGKEATPERSALGYKTAFGSNRDFVRLEYKPTTPPPKVIRPERPNAGKPIKNQDEFNKELSGLFDKIQQEGGYDRLVPIYQLRRAVGDRVTREEFNDFMFEMQAQGGFEFLEQNVEDGALDKIQDSLVTSMGKLRCYCKRT